MRKIPSFVVLLLSLAAGIAVPATSYAQDVPDEVVPGSESDDGTGAALDQIDARLRELAAEVDAPEIASRIDAIPTDSTVDAEEFRALLQEFTARALLASTSSVTVGAENLPRVRQILRRGAAGRGQRLEAALTELEEQYGDACYTQALSLLQDAADPEVDCPWPP